MHACAVGHLKPRHGALLLDEHPPTVLLPEVVPAKGAITVGGKTKNRPYAGDDQADGEDEDLDSGELER